METLIESEITALGADRALDVAAYERLRIILNKRRCFTVADMAADLLVQEVWYFRPRPS